MQDRELNHSCISIFFYNYGPGKPGYGPGMAQVEYFFLFLYINYLLTMGQVTRVELNFARKGGLVQSYW